MSAARSGNALLSQNATKSAAKAVLAALAPGFLRYVILLPLAGPPRPYNTPTFPFANLTWPWGFRITLGPCRGAADGSARQRARPPDPGPGRRQSLCKEQQDAVPDAGPRFPGRERWRAGETLGLGPVRAGASARGKWPLIHCTQWREHISRPELRRSGSPRPGGPLGSRALAWGRGDGASGFRTLRMRHWEGSRCWERSGAPPGGLLWWETGSRAASLRHKARAPGVGARTPHLGPRVLPTSVRAYLSIRSTSARCSAASSVLSACSSLRMGGVS